MLLKYIVPLFFFVTTHCEQCITSNYSEITEIVQQCHNIVLDSVIVPAGKTLSLRLLDNSRLTFRGDTTFQYHKWRGPLMEISGNNLFVLGEEGSLIDGQGQLWWDGSGSWSHLAKPKLLRLKLTNAHLENIHIQNCPVQCVSLKSSENVTLKGWFIDNLQGVKGVAPAGKEGHNTDGFGLNGASNVLIEESRVYNQDDCVVVEKGTNITVRNVLCHGSHGLSISVDTANVTDILMENSLMVNPMYGIHVKTHVDGGQGFIKNVVYRNITIFDATSYGIFIQQNYQNSPNSSTAPPKNNIPIYNLTLENISGNVAQNATPISIICAEKGCFDYHWKNVQLYGDQQLNNCTNQQLGVIC